MVDIARFAVRRIIAGIILMFLIATVVFVLAHASPYDPIHQLLGPKSTIQNVNMLRHLYGLDKPEWQQYLNFMSGLLHGNFGYSTGQSTLQTPVWSGIVVPLLPATLKLGFWALVLALFVGLPVGLVSALKQNSFLDHFSQSTMIILYVVPAFVLCPLCQFIFGDVFKVLPPVGWGDSGWIGPLGLIPNGNPSFSEMILPVSIYAAGLSGFFAKSFRSFVLEVLGQDYIRTARAKGLKGRVIIYLHLVKNTLNPLASIVGPTIAFLIIGAFIIEYFFSIPGIAKITISSITSGDYAVIETTTILLAAAVVVVNMLTDIFYALVDSRVRL